MQYEWLNKINLKTPPNDSLFDWWKRGNFVEAVNSGKPFVHFSKSGYLKEKVNFIKDKLLDEGLQVLEFTLLEKNHINMIFAKDNSIVCFNSESSFISEELTYCISIISTDAKYVNAFSNRFKEYFGERAPSSHVNMLVRCGNDYDITGIGRMSCPFEKDNYSEKIAEGYQFILKELQSPNPTGRISILQGNPGTGKSYFIRSLISEGKGSFVFIPSNLVGSLSGPELVSTLLQAQDSKPLVLIMEDADDNLISREKNSRGNNISDMLNLSDGLLGELADIRIIATTNLPKLDLDEALTREGRLSIDLEFEELTRDQTAKVYKNLTQKDLENPKAMSLAQVYNMAKGGWEAPKKKAKTSGQYV